MDTKDTKKQLCRIGRKMKEGGLVVACDGNISYRRDDGLIVITPSGVPKGELRPSDLLVIDSKGQIVKGKGKASSETSLHLEIYKARPDVKAIVHCHPVTATAVSVAQRLDLLSDRDGRTGFPRPCRHRTLCRTGFDGSGHQMRPGTAKGQRHPHGKSRGLCRRFEPERGLLPHGNAGIGG